jgi:hypothetical protein
VRALVSIVALLAFASVGCGGPETTGRADTGMVTNMDGGMSPDGAFLPPADTGTAPGVDVGPRMDVGCVPGVEICGDHMDQDCNGRDVSCGDNDHDGTQACRPEDTDLTMCDCDDTRAEVRPSFGGLPGAPEACDGLDNNCNGRVDEAAACCAGCASLGSDTGRADVCDESGACDCSTEPGTGACAAGEACCSAGCTDLDTDLMNCGFCGSQCTVSADHCGPGADGRGTCLCGSGPACDLDTACTGGGC